MLNNTEKKDGNEKEKKIIKRYSLRMTEDEYEQIKNKAFESRLSMNDYIKKSARDKVIIVVEGLRDLTIEIKRIGTNINQITKHLNAGNNLTVEEKEILLSEEKKLWQLLKQFTAENL